MPTSNIARAKIDGEPPILISRARDTAPVRHAEDHGAADITSGVAPVRSIVKDQLVDITGEQAKDHPPRRGCDQVAESRSIGQLHVDASGLEGSDVEKARSYLSDRTEVFPWPRRIAIDLTAQWIASVNGAAAEDLGSVEGSDRAADVDRIVVRSQAQPGHEARFEDHADGRGIGLFGHELTIPGGPYRHEGRLAGPERIGDLLEIGGTRPTQLIEGRRADVTRTHGSQAQAVDQLLGQAELPRPDPAAGAVVAVARCAIELEPAKQRNLLDQRNQGFAKSLDDRDLVSTIRSEKERRKPLRRRQRVHGRGRALLAILHADGCRDRSGPERE